MEALSSRYGWTPDQIRDMAQDDVLQYLEIIGEIQNIERIRAMKNKQK